MSGSFLILAGCPLLALLLQSSSDSTSVDKLLLEDIRFAEELRPLIRTRSIEAVRDNPHMTSALGGVEGYPNSRCTCTVVREVSWILHQKSAVAECGQGWEGGTKFQNFVDVICGWSLRAFFPNMRAKMDDEVEAEEGRQELGGLLEVVMTQDETDRSKKSNGK